MRPTQILNAVREAGTAFVHIVVGLLLMAGGGWVIAYQLQHPPHSDKIILGGGVIVVLGALLMPTIFPVFKQIVVLVFPNGIPVIGGKRATDPAPVAKVEDEEGG